jgi:hypothetical protein
VLEEILLVVKQRPEPLRNRLPFISGGGAYPFDLAAAYHAGLVTLGGQNLMVKG